MTMMMMMKFPVLVCAETTNLVIYTAQKHELKTDKQSRRRCMPLQT